MDPGKIFVYATAWASLACYIVALSMRFLPPSSSHEPTDFKVSADPSVQAKSVASVVWLAGALGFLIHVLAAFHFVHHWDHASAVAETALRTKAVVGSAWGGGLYVNYLFLLVWLADAFWWMASPASYLRRSKVWEWPTQFFLAFIAFNGAVVFGRGPIFWFGSLATLWLFWVCWKHFSGLRQATAVIRR